MKRSKLVKQTLLVSIFLFVLLVVVLIISNLDWIRHSFGTSKRAEMTQETEEVEMLPEGQIGNNLNGFLSDDDFFDKKTPDVIITTGTHEKEVSLILSSVAKDLRIMVIDYIGRLVVGTPFSVTIEGMGSYTDDDMDGIIYIDKLRAGQYFVSLDPVEGYDVPDTKNMITVKDELIYAALPDISYMIRTAEDINAGAEDTEERLARDEADGTENSEQEAYRSIGDVGIDVSDWNQAIDWNAVASDGVDFAIIRCGYRGSQSGALVQDARFSDNIQGAVKAGLKVGVYFFTQAVDETEAVEEASAALSLCRLYHLDLPIYVDSESAGGKGRADRLEPEARTKILRAFCDTIENEGNKAGIYGSKNWLTNELNMDELTGYSVWLAQYSEISDYDGYYDLWQYTSRGRVSGIDTLVDLDVSYK